jgi:hypothetical protein
MLKESCNHEVFKRGEVYYKNNKVNNRRKKDSKIYARVKGTRNYGVVIQNDGEKLTTYCSCPYYFDDKFCKHIVATGLAFIEEPESFIDMKLMKDKIYNQEQNLLAELMSMVVEIYPDLVDDMGLHIKDGIDFDGDKIVSLILNELDPLDTTEMDLVVRRLKTVMARAEIEFDRKNHDIARKIIFHTVKNCLKLDEKYDTAEILPMGFVAYIYTDYKWMVDKSAIIDEKVINSEVEELKNSIYYNKEGLNKIL